MQKQEVLNIQQVRLQRHLLLLQVGITNTIFKHFLFDIEMFTHLNIRTAQAFTQGEKITDGSTGGTGTVESISNVESLNITNISVANPGVVTTASNHNFKESKQVTISSVGGMAIDSVAQDSSARVFTVRNPGASTFELYSSDGTTKMNVTTQVQVVRFNTDL